jgi:hypothetical protein
MIKLLTVVAATCLLLAGAALVLQREAEPIAAERVIAGPGDTGLTGKMSVALGPRDNGLSIRMTA